MSIGNRHLCGDILTSEADLERAQGNLIAVPAALVAARQVWQHEPRIRQTAKEVLELWKKQWLT